MSVSVNISIDTEEDDWGRYDFEGASTRNIAHLEELQDLFGEFGARPTYLVNRPPLIDRASVAVLGRLGALEGVEIGAHCHPWNTLAEVGGGEDRSWMFRLDVDVNRRLIREVASRIRSELGVVPTTFRAGRWGWGPSVAKALQAEGFRTDCSVTPLIDWSDVGGADFTGAPLEGYRFDPHEPLVPRPEGALLELPTTVGVLKGRDTLWGPFRVRVERSPLARLGLVGALDRLGIAALRWMSPEVTSGRDLVALAANAARQGRSRIDLTFHSCALLPGATPFVRDDHDRKELLNRIRTFLRFTVESGFRFRTLGELAEEGAPAV